MPSCREILLAHIPGLRRYARALIGSRQDADDLVHECVIRALARQDCWSEIRNVRAYLFSILHNVYIDGTRSSIPAGRMIHLDACRSLPAFAAPQPRRLELMDLERALRLLPEEQRQVVLLVGLEGMSYREAAEVLNTPIGTVMSRLSRGREALRQMMAGQVQLTARRSR